MREYLIYASLLSLPLIRAQSYTGGGILGKIFKLVKETRDKMIELRNLILNLDDAGARLRQALDIAEAKLLAKDATIAEQQASIAALNARVAELSEGDAVQQARVDQMAQGAAGMAAACQEFMNRVG